MRSAHLDPHFRQTDILGALRLASDLFSQHPQDRRKVLVLFPDMRQVSPELSLESVRSAPFSLAHSILSKKPLALQGVDIYVVGVDGAGRSIQYFDSLLAFWSAYFETRGATLRSY